MSDEWIPVESCRKTMLHQAGEFTAACNRLGDEVLRALPRRLRWREVGRRPSACRGCGRVWS